MSPSSGRRSVRRYRMYAKPWGRRRGRGRGCRHPDGHNVIERSAAHVLAQAVQQQFLDAKLSIGLPVKDGFYYDFQVDKPFTSADLEAAGKAL